MPGAGQARTDGGADAGGPAGDDGDSGGRDVARLGHGTVLFLQMPWPLRRPADCLATAVSLRAPAEYATSTSSVRRTPK